MKWLPVKQNIAFFLSSEFFTDALRTTISILLPAWILFTLGKPDVAVAVGVGTLLTSLTDSSGTYHDKRAVSLVSILLFFFVALITSYTWQYPWLMGSVLFVFCFTLSMLTTLGNRFAMVGTTAIALSIFINGLKPQNGFEFSAYILTGGVCYYLLTLVHALLWPFRSLRQAVAECLKTTAMYMSARTAFYNPHVPLEKAYQQIIPFHTLVNEKHEAVRDLLLRDKLAMRPDNPKGQRLLKIATLVIDLYERITTVHFDYRYFRNEFETSGAPEVISRFIDIMAQRLEQAGNAVYQGKQIKSDAHTNELHYLRRRLQYIIEKESDRNRKLLQQLESNVNDIEMRIQALSLTVVNEEAVYIADDEVLNYPEFISNSPRMVQQFKSHLHWRSPLFRFSLRLAIACLFGYVLTQMLPLGYYSYWIMLTVVVVMKPAFSITTQRNRQRLIGTLAGVAAGFLIITLIKNGTALLVLSLVFLLGFFTYARSRYLVGVLFITPMVIICLHIYSGGKFIFIIERIYDTLIGCGIAFAASYLFPVWERYNVTNYVYNVLEANYAYLEAYYKKISGEQISFNHYKLLRKNVYMRLADFSAAFKRLLSEPNKKSIPIDDLESFQALNHQLYGNVASLSLQSFQNRANDADNAQAALAAEALNKLKSCLTTLKQLPSNDALAHSFKNDSHDNNYLSNEEHEQLQSIISAISQLQKLTKDIAEGTQGSL
ncbi:FUSC family membrane protein [Mucilaginibacter aquatilis]|uniref:Uncharacterized protein n=1 Tax=Mucilaginibacter aquatilis TaxID=1517760 RepID=A0A6I4I876_9SPHI|nr:FUSC family membrane protein [Mucilaginibacter aquatilis]MVN89626.1 hypothetical protein [Mucilaginibacter aquatilis]